MRALKEWMIRSSCSNKGLPVLVYNIRHPDLNSPHIRHIRICFVYRHVTVPVYNTTTSATCGKMYTWWNWSPKKKENPKRNDVLYLEQAFFWILQSIWYQTLNISYTESALETTALRHCLWTGYKNHFDMTNPCITIFTGYFWDMNSCFGGHSHRMQGVYNIRHPFIASAGSI